MIFANLELKHFNQNIFSVTHNSNVSSKCIQRDIIWCMCALYETCRKYFTMCASVAMYVKDANGKRNIYIIPL